MNKKNIKICRYCNCPYPSKLIDINEDEFAVDGIRYYHKKCYEIKLDEDEKQRQKSEGYQQFRDLWLKNISNTVVYSELHKVLGELISRGIELDYLIYTLNYVIEHKLNLHYPAGFRYFVDRKEIKDAYTKKKSNMSSVCSKENFVITKREDNSPKFSINKEARGFQSIFKSNTK